VIEKNQGAENWRGILWAMLSVIGASAMAISVRGASLGLDTKLIVGYRLFFTLILNWNNNFSCSKITLKSTF